MDDALSVSFVESIGNLHSYLQGLLQRERTGSQPVSESFALQKLHDDEIDSVLRADVVQAANIRMCEQTDSSRFALKAPFQIRHR